MFLPTYRETPVTNHQLSADSWQALLFFATDKTVWLCSSTPRASYRGATLPYFNLEPQDKQNNRGQHCQGRHTMSELFLGDDKIWGYNLLTLQIMNLWTFDKEVEMSSKQNSSKNWSYWDLSWVGSSNHMTTKMSILVSYNIYKAIYVLLFAKVHSAYSICYSNTYL